jgi:hypothetical protein
MANFTTFRGRRAVQLENAQLRLTVLVEGGHIAELLHKASGVSPLWMPVWPSIEPSLVDAGRHPEFGTGSDARLLAGIMGHNLCLDIFGGPSDEEAAAGLSAHGEASIAPYTLDVRGETFVASADLPLAALRVEREIVLHARGLRVRESVENLSACDRPVGWTEHVTLGPPFLERGSTAFRASAGRSKTFERAFGADDTLEANAEFMWPDAPAKNGGTIDLRVFTSAAASSGYTAHLMDPARTHAYVLAFSPTSQLAFGCLWRRSDFPWFGRWEENHSRTQSPWNGASLTWAMEFGVSPFPESRREMIDRGSLFGVPTYRWIPAKSRVAVEYQMRLERATTIPESLDWTE